MKTLAGLLLLVAAASADKATATATGHQRAQARAETKYSGVKHYILHFLLVGQLRSTILKERYPIASYCSRSSGRIHVDRIKCIGCWSFFAVHWSRQ